MEYPIINVETENEHFEFSDSVISWMEKCKTSAKGLNCDDDHDDHNNKDLLKNILLATQQSSSQCHHQLSAPGLTCNLIRIFCERHGRTLNDSLANLIPQNNSNDHQQHNQLQYNNIDSSSPSPKTQPSSPDLLNTSTTHSELSTSPQHTGKSSIPSLLNTNKQTSQDSIVSGTEPSLVSHNNAKIQMRGNDEWAPPRAQIIFNIHEETNFRKSMQKQNYLCAGCGTKIDLELARRLVLYCHYLGKYFCKCCFSHKAIHLPGYILQKWDFHKYPVSHFALQLLDKIANEPLFNINDINSSLYRKVRKLKHLIDIRMQLYYLKIYISTCTQTDKLNGEYSTFCHQHLLQDDVHLYSLNNLIEIQHGKLYEYLNDLVSRSIAHIAQCDRCRAKGHYCQLCGPSSLITSMISSGNTNSSTAKMKHSMSVGQNMSGVAVSGTSSGLSLIASSLSPPPPVVPPTTPSTLLIANTNDHQLIFPFEIGRVAQCRGCGCCFHLQCYIDAGQNCPKCERIQRRKAELLSTSASPTTIVSNDQIDQQSVSRKT